VKRLGDVCRSGFFAERIADAVEVWTQESKRETSRTQKKQPLGCWLIL